MGKFWHSNIKVSFLKVRDRLNLRKRVVTSFSLDYIYYFKCQKCFKYFLFIQYTEICKFQFLVPVLML